MLLSSFASAQDDNITYMTKNSFIEFPKSFSGCSSMSLVKTDNSSNISVSTIYDITKSIDFSAIKLSATDNGTTWIVTIPPQNDIELVGSCNVSIEVKKSKDLVKN